MNSGNNAVRTIMAPLVEGKFWMKLLGVLMILSGALQAITIVGLLWAWLPIWLGVLLFQSCGEAERAMSSEDTDGARRATDKLRLFFMIQGILVLIMLVCFALVMFLGVGGAMLGAMSGMRGMHGM